MSYSVEIIGNQAVDGHTEYSFRVRSPSDGEWTFQRRYKVIRALSDDLSARAPVVLPPFPPKKCCGNMNPAFVAQRQSDLQGFFRTLCSLPKVSRLAIFLDFVKPADRVVIPKMMTANVLDSKYFGLHTSRYQSATTVGSQLVHPLGSYIVSRNSANLQVLSSHKAHDCCIMVLLCIPFEQPTHFVSMAYDGQVKLLTAAYQELSVVQASQSSLRNGAASTKGDLVAACTSHGLYNGIIDVWRVQDEELVPVFRVQGNYKACEFTEENYLFALRMSVVDDGQEYRFQRDFFIPPERACLDFAPEDDSSLSNAEIISAVQKHSLRPQCYYACIFKNFENELITNSLFIDYYGRINVFKVNRQGQAVLGTVTRMIYVIDMNSMTILHALRVVGSGSIMTIDFIGTHLYFSPATHLFCRFDTAQPALMGEIDPAESYKFLNTIEVKKSWVSPITASLSWSQHERTLIGANEYGMYSISFEAYPVSNEVVEDFELSLFSMTCCGLAVHPSGDLIAVGDFGGTITVWQGDQLRFKDNIGYPIRSISWAPKGEDLYVGSMNASLHVFKDVLSGQSQSLTVANVEDSVICMAWKRGETEDFLALGTAQGELVVFSLSDGFLQKEQSFIAHAADKANEDMRFGSLKLFSEIWTLAWSPLSTDLLATGSEDQFVHIWNWRSQTLLQTLPKHDRAVTGVRWTIINPCQGIDEILVSCSDDMTMRVYNAKNWEMVHLIETSFIQEWHTITYCAIEEGGVRLACVTQNGFLLVYNLETQVFDFAGRLHNGSVEGLDWQKGTLATCSSDCTCCVINTRC